MTNSNAKIIEVKISQTSEKWFLATSDELPGLFIAHPDEAAVLSDIPVTIKAIFQEQYEVDVEVVMADHVDEQNIPFVAVPAALLTARG